MTPLADMIPARTDAELTTLRANAARGIVSRISDVKPLQGDLSEAWGEGAQDYATVAMRYALKDVKLDRASNRVVGTEPSEATELWTFTQIHKWQLADGLGRAARDAVMSAFAALLLALAVAGLWLRLRRRKSGSRA